MFLRMKGNKKRRYFQAFTQYGPAVQRPAALTQVSPAIAQEQRAKADSRMTSYTLGQ